MFDLQHNGEPYRFLGDELEIYRDKLADEMLIEPTINNVCDLFEFFTDQGWTPPPHAKRKIAERKPVEQKEVLHAACAEGCPHRYTDEKCICTADLY